MLTGPGARRLRAALGITVCLGPLCVQACAEDAVEPIGWGNPGACTPGETQACSCDPNGSGTQQCNEDGSGYLPCDCGAGGSAGTAGAAGKGGGAAGKGGMGGVGGGSSGTAGAASAGGTGGQSGAGGTGGHSGAGGAAGAAGAPATACSPMAPGSACLVPGYSWRCTIVPGKSVPEWQATMCAVNEQCVDVGNGSVCSPKPNSCTPEGARACGAPGKLRTCAQGTWVETDCSSCRITSGGALCDPPIATTSISRSIHYASRVPNQDYTGWSSLGQMNAAVRMPVHSRRGSTPIDETLTDANGNFTIRIPAVPQAGDVLAISTRRTITSSSGASASFAILPPSLSPGVHEVGSFQVSLAPNQVYATWGWSWDLTQPLPASLDIFPDSNSGILHVFQKVGRLLDLCAQSWFGTASNSLVIWMKPNVTWDCGACEWHMAAPGFSTQIFLGMDADEEYWSDAVFGHEFGHYVMDTWGVAPNEGGTHCLGGHYSPGFAWSEGWATWFSAASNDRPRDPSVYFDVQGGTFFSFNIATRTYPSAVPWTRPIASAGLSQTMDENEVAAMMWNMSSNAQIGSSRMFNALKSPRMTQPPFGRGYTTHTWDSNGCTPTNIADTGEPAPMFADFLDALVCSGAPASGIDAACEPASHYPYPSSAPICN
jgi:hypothetical protein